MNPEQSAPGFVPSIFVPPETYGTLPQYSIALLTIVCPLTAASAGCGAAVAPRLVTSMSTIKSMLTLFFLHFFICSSPFVIGIRSLYYVTIIPRAIFPVTHKAPAQMDILPISCTKKQHGDLFAVLFHYDRKTVSFPVSLSSGRRWKFFRIRP